MGQIQDRDDLKFSQDWFTKNLPEVLYWVKPTIKSIEKPKILEIGAFEGFSTRWFVQNFLQDGGEIHTVDTWNGSLEHENWGMDFTDTYDVFTHNLKEYIEDGICITYRGESKDILPKFLCSGEKFDFIYIDGSHLASDVMIDGMLSYLLVKDGGIIMFDDYVFGITDMRKPDIPYTAIEFIRTSFTDRGRLELLGLNLTAVFKKIK